MTLCVSTRFKPYMEACALISSSCYRENYPAGLRASWDLQSFKCLKGNMSLQSEVHISYIFCMPFGKQ